MKRLFRTSALAALVLLASSARSSAGNIVFTLNDVKLGVAIDGEPNSFISAGDLTGAFTPSEDLKTLVAVDIKASEATIGVYHYSPRTYTLEHADLNYSYPANSR